MKPVLAQVVSFWPFGASLAAVAAQALYVGRRRAAVNEALHELRRPLQALALVAPGGRADDAAPVRGAVELAAAALERLEREVNGGSVAAERGSVAARPLVEAAVGRWTGRAGQRGRTLSLHWAAVAEVAVVGDRRALAQALDNLIVNAIEHGGAEVAIEGRLVRGALEVAVVDSGRGAPAPWRGAALGSRPRRRLAGPVSWLSGRRRHGHGLRVVARTAADHGGAFRLSRGERGTRAALELPLAGTGLA